MATDPLLLASADPLAKAISWLRSSALIAAEFGGPTHVSGQNRAPYPHVRVTASPGGSDRDLVWATDPELMVEVYGEMDGTPGAAALWRLSVIVFGELARMPETPSAAGTAAVSRVRKPSATTYAEDPVSGQPRWFAPVGLTVHPVPA